ncbi:protein-disulfide isomerase [Candidatus Phycorickettsia trachydisci]|uniref:Protein-disulfide isomerase n=1 Tax=Candidatus Phycorickettsia trachydisci TaxID=2115978 RepID=A0A2P1P7U9_9RICK|nr:thioredoxin domain-containing protein [Candidatus Phycorickettsia trachydisci]AVP87336.1 protein-disulfide isomerase [Candidatus Phycorickettsia trachydisci]
MFFIDVIQSKNLIFMGLLKSIVLALLISSGQSIAGDQSHYEIQDTKPASPEAIKASNDLELNIVQDVWMDDAGDDGTFLTENLESPDNQEPEKGKVNPIDPDKVDSKQEVKNEPKQEVKTNESPKLSKAELAKQVFAIDSDDIVLGNSKSPVLVIEYTAMTCPHCAHYHTSVYNKIKAKYIDTGRIAYVVRNVVWSRQDMDSAILARCDQTKFAAFSNVLYGRQRSWAFGKNYQDVLINIGKLGGISEDKYNKCLNNDDMKNALILKTKKFAEVLDSQLIPTPAIVVNGKVLNQHSFEEISAEIDKNLHAPSLAYHE